MKKCNVVFWGSIGLVKRKLEEIVIKRNVNLLGVCCVPMNNSWRTEVSNFVTN
jgi:UDP-4-amino-4-deoxy-L-arabinose formyltransferase/UDP-glucuronic acid dehydrogenase (UDP-4-keto-hexauronic acid decarboxylating)